MRRYVLTEASIQNTVILDLRPRKETYSRIQWCHQMLFVERYEHTEGAETVLDDNGYYTEARFTDEIFARKCARCACVIAAQREMRRTITD